MAASLESQGNDIEARVEVSDPALGREEESNMSRWWQAAEIRTHLGGNLHSGTSQLLCLWQCRSAASQAGISGLIN